MNGYRCKFDQFDKDKWYAASMHVVCTWDATWTHGNGAARCCPPRCEAGECARGFAKAGVCEWPVALQRLTLSRLSRALSCQHCVELLDIFWIARVADGGQSWSLGQDHRFRFVSYFGLHLV